MFWFIVLLLLAGAGFYFYQKLTKIESEIRAEQDAEITRATAAKAQQDAPEKARDESATTKPKADPAKVEPVAEKPTAEPVVKTEETSELETQIVAAVVEQPGVKQTELYGKFADINKKQLQTLLKDMADNGALKRKKQGSSYSLYPA